MANAAKSRGERRLRMSREKESGSQRGLLENFKSLSEKELGVATARSPPITDFSPILILLPSPFRRVSKLLSIETVRTKLRSMRNLSLSDWYTVYEQKLKRLVNVAVSLRLRLLSILVDSNSLIYMVICMSNFEVD